MNPGTTRSLRRKLFKIVLSVFLLLGITTLAGSAWVNAQTERERLAEIESQVRKSIASKARVTTQVHALALRGLVAENAFTDVEELVNQAVEADPDIVYGVFVSAEGKAWAYVSPTTRQRGSKTSRDTLKHWHELSLPPDSWKSNEGSEGQARLFGQDLFQVSRPVVDDGEVLGRIGYGFSTEPLREALAGVQAESQLALRRTLLWSALGIALSTLAAFSFTSRAASRIVRPLQNLTAAAQRIADGARGVRVTVETNDELQVLGRAFNDMQTANEEALRELSEAMDAALEASRLKSEFVANMSHEIRTPMNGIMGMMNLISQMPLDRKLRRYVETVTASAGALMTIINDVLDFSKMEAGKYTLLAEPFDPSIVLQEVAELQSGRARDKGLEFVYRCDPTVPRQVTGDPDRYRQVINNLVSNAIKFSDKGEVLVDLKVDSVVPDAVVLRTIVQDTGVGIAPEDQGRLFKAFSQVDGSAVRRHGGTGLGLAISKRLVEMMNGRIDLRSERGVGTTFSFTIRVAVAESPALSQRTGLPTGRRVFVVEASRRWCHIIEEHIVAWGLSCDVHHDGLPALEHLRRTHQEDPYDVLVVGAPLRDISISAFVKQTRQIPSAHRVPLIVLTELGETETFSEVEKEVRALVAKPLRLSELRDRIVEILEGKQRKDSAPNRRNTRRSGPRAQVLIVDDNEINQYVAAEQVKAAGYESDIAANGEDALHLVQQRQYDLVLMDCQMPVMDGYTAARMIRAWEGDRQHTPIIALTAHAMVGERDKVLSAGMDDYLSKPIEPASLERILRRYTSRKAQATGHTPAVATAPDPDAPIELNPTLARTPRLCGLFLTHVPDTLQELDAAVGKQDASRIRDRAHKLKGSCLAVGADAMAQLAETLQVEAERGEISRSAERLSSLVGHFERVAVLLRREVERSGSFRPKPVATRRSDPPGQAPPA